MLSNDCGRTWASGTVARIGLEGLMSFDHKELSMELLTQPILGAGFATTDTMAKLAIRTV